MSAFRILTLPVAFVIFYTAITEGVQPGGSGSNWELKPVDLTDYKPEIPSYSDQYCDQHPAECTPELVTNETPASNSYPDSGNSDEDVYKIEEPASIPVSNDNAYAILEPETSGDSIYDADNELQRKDPYDSYANDYTISQPETKSDALPHDDCANEPAEKCLDNECLNPDQAKGEAGQACHYIEREQALTEAECSYRQCDEIEQYDDKKEHDETPLWKKICCYCCPWLKDQDKKECIKP